MKGVSTPVIITSLSLPSNRGGTPTAIITFPYFFRVKYFDGEIYFSHKVSLGHRGGQFINNEVKEYRMTFVKLSALGALHHEMNETF